MNTTEMYEEFLKFICEEYERGGIVRERGELANVLVNQFERKKGLNLGNVYGQNAAVMYLGNGGWIRKVSPLGEYIRGTPNSIICRIQPTPEGIAHFKRTRSLAGILPVGAEVLGRFVKGLLGK